MTNAPKDEVNQPFRPGWDFFLALLLGAIPAGYLANVWLEGYPLYSRVAGTCVGALFLTIVIYGPCLLWGQVRRSDLEGKATAGYGVSFILIAGGVCTVMYFLPFTAEHPSWADIVWRLVAFVVWLPVAYVIHRIVKRKEGTSIPSSQSPYQRNPFRLIRILVVMLLRGFAPMLVVGGLFLATVGFIGWMERGFPLESGVYPDGGYSLGLILGVALAVFGVILFHSTRRPR